jgi:hypothetical protein
VRSDAIVFQQVTDVSEEYNASIFKDIFCQNVGNRLQHKKHYNTEQQACFQCRENSNLMNKVKFSSREIESSSTDQ